MNFRELGAWLVGSFQDSSYKAVAANSNDHLTDEGTVQDNNLLFRKGQFHLRQSGAKIFLARSNNKKVRPDKVRANIATLISLFKIMQVLGESIPIFKLHRSYLLASSGLLIFLYRKRLIRLNKKPTENADNGSESCEKNRGLPAVGCRDPGS